MPDADYDALVAELRALVGDHVYDYAPQDTGVPMCRKHDAAGYQAACPMAWLRKNLPSVFPPAEGSA